MKTLLIYHSGIVKKNYKPNKRYNKRRTLNIKKDKSLVINSGSSNIKYQSHKIKKTGFCLWQSYAIDIHL